VELTTEKLFDGNSKRAHKAHIAVAFTPFLISILNAATILLVLLGIMFVLVGFSYGWLVVGLSAVPAMVVEWYRGELQKLLPSKSGNRIDDILSSDLLGRLSPHPSPFELATVVGNVAGGHFFAVRFGIGIGFLQQITSTDSKDTDAIWKQAVIIQKQTDSPYISAGIVLIALLQSFPAHETLLAHLQLDSNDLIDGIKWYTHLQNLVDQPNTRRRTGGIARDWSFGWIPLLSRFGQNISQQLSQSGPLLKLSAHQDALDQLIKTFDGTGRQVATLVGQTGVGKAEIVYAFADTLLDATSNIPNSLKFRQIFTMDASAIISAATGPGDLENLMTRLLNEAYSAKNIILCFENAQLFFEEGTGSVDLTNLLLPVLQAGSLPIILTMDDQQYLKITQRSPGLSSSDQRITVNPTTPSETMAVMQDQVIIVEFQHRVTYMYQALKEAYRLSERYVHDLGMPGRALQLLESSAGFADQGLVTANSIQQAIEKTVGVKISNAHKTDERETLLNLEKLIHARMIGQTHAVSVVSDAIRRARTGVRNAERPIGTFMFLGPTGVGKTELAKALAAVYFGGESHIIRLDMNEYVGAKDVNRLIADASTDANSLAAQVLKHPFSVILLDEIEKAHDSVLTTLLQVLDEGILRDINNREISFKDAIIIATSNAGAERIREYIDRGLDIAQLQDQITNELISSNQFRPEFLNRFDEIVVFGPLTKSELLQVVDLILADVNKTLALQKITVQVSLEAKQYLVDAGYDPRLGARPMRRVVQRAVENTVAKQMLSGTVEAGGTVDIDLGQVQSLISSAKQADELSAGTPPLK
jgi:ATP-dependent Clp protease ATP-binding subunit ClpC